MKNICVFCGSNSGNRPIYKESAIALAKIMHQQGKRLIYGGGSVGLMGIIADAMMDLGGEVIGVIPAFLEEKEVGHKGLTKMIVVESMHERKLKMADLSDAFIAMPGGCGTMEELFEIFTWGQLGLHQKPFGLLNTAAYYDHLSRFLDHMEAERFLSQSNRNMLMIDDQPELLLQKMAAYEAPEFDKWLEDSRT